MPSASQWKYTVGKACQILGYGSKEESSDRYWRKLSIPARDSFVLFASKNGITEYLNPKLAEQCSTSFCDSNEHLFPTCPKAIECGWPCLPGDRDRIIDDLTHLITIQHIKRARGTSYEAVAKRGCKNRAVLKSDTSTSSSDENDSDDEEHAGTGYVKDSRKAEARRRGAEALRLARLEEQDKQVQSNIKEHLRCAYPEGSAVDAYIPCDIWHYPNLQNHPVHGWLFKNGPNTRWPSPDKAFLWRQMHENNCYSQTPSIDQVEPTVEGFFKYLKIDCSSAQFALIYKKVERFIVTWTRRWVNEYGLLQKGKEKGTFSRTQMFEKAWDVQMTTWHNLHDPSGLSMLVNESKDEDVHQDKRQKKTVSQAGSSSNRRSPSPNRRSSCFQIFNTDGLPQDGSSGEIITGFQRQQDEATKMTIAKRSESPATSENELIQEDLYSSSPPPNVHKRSHPNATTFTDQKPNIPSTRLSSISPPETPFSEKLSSSKRVTLPSPESMPVDSAVTTIKTGGEVNVILIFQSSTGDMDFQSKVPSSMLRTSTLQQFFHKYSQRSGISLEQFSTLTFDIVFANNESFEVHSSDSAADWRDFKVEIKKLLDETKAAKPRLSEFEIWVKPEKAALTQTVDDVDDGLDGL